MRKIKHAKFRHKIENLILRVLIVAAIVFLVGTVGGLIFYRYLLFKFGM